MYLLLIEWMGTFDESTNYWENSGKWTSVDWLSSFFSQELEFALGKICAAHFP